MKKTILATLVAASFAFVSTNSLAGLNYTDTHSTIINIEEAVWAVTLEADLDSIDLALDSTGAGQASFNIAAGGQANTPDSHIRIIDADNLELVNGGQVRCTNDQGGTEMLLEVSGYDVSKLPIDAVNAGVVSSVANLSFDYGNQNVLSGSHVCPFGTVSY